MTEIQFDGLHYETGSVRNLFALQGIHMPHTGSPPSEALLLGLSGGVTFGYFSFAYKGIDPFVALLTRNTFDPLENLFNRMGVVRTVKQTTDEAKAEKNLADALDNGQPVLVWADRFSLPYHTDDGLLGEGMYEMTPLVVFARDSRDGTAQIADGSRRPLQVSGSDLARARGRVKKDKYRLMTLSLPSFDKLNSGVISGIRASIQSFHNVPMKGYARNFGFAAFERWADVLTSDKDKQSWSKVFPAGKPMYAGLVSAFDRIELFGTGGAASRPLFADFLQEASLLLEKPALRASAARFREVGTSWSRLSKALLPDDVPAFRETRQLMLSRQDLYWERGAAAKEEIVHINDRLKEIRSSMETGFPLSSEEGIALKQNLRDQILRIHDAEKEAINELEKGLVN
jgi:hypothetical protein